MTQYYTADEIRLAFRQLVVMGTEVGQGELRKLRSDILVLALEVQKDRWRIRLCSKAHGLLMVWLSADEVQRRTHIGPEWNVLFTHFKGVANILQKHPGVTGEPFPRDLVY